MNRGAIDADLALDPAWRDRLRLLWRQLIDVAVFGELKGSHTGAMARLRKRALEIGEQSRSLFSDRDWIPQRRERLKNAIASSLALRQGVAALALAAQDVGGGRDHSELKRLLHEFDDETRARLPALENHWAALLDGLNRIPDEENGVT